MRTGTKVAALAATAILLMGAGGALNGFALESPSVERSLIVRGADRDRIESVDAPEFYDSAEAQGVFRPDIQVLGVAIGELSRAYPVHLMEYHQIVNDELGGTPLLVTYDPLTSTPLAFRREVAGGAPLFHVSGLLYNSNFLLYDAPSQSLWSQFLGLAVDGKREGARLERLPIRQETLSQWYQRHPKTQVLKPPKPRQHDYRVTWYSNYWIEDGIVHPVKAKDESIHSKRLVLGVVVDGKPRAYLDDRVMATGGVVEDDFQDRRIRLSFFEESAVFVWDIPEDVQVTEAYWFAWKAFHPETDLWGKPPQATSTGE